MTLAVTGCVKVTSHAPDVVNFTGFALPDGKFEVMIEFDGALDPASVVADVTVVLTVDGVNVPVTAATEPSGDALVITTVSDYVDVCTFTPNCVLDLRLVGTGPAPMTDAGGTAIDGDADGQAGGDFTTRFGILG
jgi:hypothetical protein